MAITIITDLSDVAANAYADVDFVDAYHEARLFNTEWTGETDAEKKKAVIVWATRIMENFPWAGDKYVASALRFGRENMTDRDGIAIPNNVVPLDIQKAMAELALFLLREDRTAGPDVVMADVQQIGPMIDRKFKYNKYPPEFIALVSPYLKGGLSSVNVGVTRV